MMNIVVHPELQTYIDPLTADERDALERSLLAEGCRDALVLWGDVLVDGHNRYALCLKHGLPFQTTQHPHFRSLDDVRLWMIDQHLGRRSISDFQRGSLALRKREIIAAQRAGRLQATPVGAVGAVGADDTGRIGLPPEGAAAASTVSEPAPLPPVPAPLDSREALARAARLSAHQVVMIEKIQRHAAPEVVAAVKAGALSISAAAAVASLPPEEQVAAAQAGADELRQAARRVREARRKPREAAPVATAAISGADSAAASTAVDTAADVDIDIDVESVPALRQRVAELLAENAALRRQLADLQAR